jgi:hypothetical protein
VEDNYKKATQKETEIWENVVIVEKNKKERKKFRVFKKIKQNKNFSV